MRSCSRSSVLRGMSRRVGELNKIRAMGPVNRIDSVVDRGVHEGEASSGMDGWWLCTRRPHDDEQSLVPLHYWIGRLSTILEGRRIRLVDLYQEAREQREHRQNLRHRNYPLCLVDSRVADGIDAYSVASTPQDASWISLPRGSHRRRCPRR